MSNMHIYTYIHIYKGKLPVLSWQKAINYAHVSTPGNLLFAPKPIDFDETILKFLSRILLKCPQTD